MNCPNCSSYVSGDYCHICETIISLKPQKPKKIKQRSDKKKIDDLVYKAKRLKFLKENPRCSVYPELKATDVHHKRGRGSNYLDEKTWLAVSRKAHIEIEENPEWAVSKGYSELRLKNYEAEGVENDNQLEEVRDRKTSERDE